MITQTMSITDLRKNVFDVVQASIVNKQITEIMLHGEVVVDIIPHVKKKFDWDKYIKEQMKDDNIIRSADWSDLKKFRKDFDNKIKGW